MPSTQDPRSGLYHGWSAGESGWGEQMSANLRRIGRVLTHLSVLDRDVSDPSTLTPADGDSYIIAAGATGDWAGYDGHVAVWDAGASAWTIYAPRTGWLAYIEDEQVLSVYRAGAWSAGISI